MSRPGPAGLWQRSWRHVGCVRPGPDPAPDLLDTEARGRILDSLAQRGSAEIGALVLPAVLTALYARHAPAWPMLLWWAGFLLSVLALRIARFDYLRARAAGADAAAIRRGGALLTFLAAFNGFGWGSLVLVALHNPSYEYHLLLYLALSAVIASTTTFLAPLRGVFFSFFIACWGQMVLLVVPLFPGQWQYLLPMLLLYGAITGRHAWGARRFTLQQIGLERQHAALAEQYRIAHDQAERALAEKNRFLSVVSHDLRQPLHAMALLVQAAQHPQPPERLAPVLADLQGCVHSLNLMFNGLLDQSRLEDGSFVPVPADVPADALLAEAATVFGPDARSRGLRLRLRTPRRRAAVLHADPSLLRQMLFNLVQNALRYTPEGGVLVGVRPAGGAWRIEVWDTGTGIAEADRAHIHQPHFRSGGARARDREGHGLGLAGVARAAELAGARHGFASRVGRGSCFWIEVRAGHCEAKPPKAGKPAPPTPLSGRCLLVDDDPQVRAGWQALVASWGLQAQMADGTAEAHAAIDRGFRPDVILCDERLGTGESGYGLLQALLARCPGARGAMVSGELFSPALAQADDDGYLVLKKPLAPEVLHAVLARWLRPA